MRVAATAVLAVTVIPACGCARRSEGDASAGSPPAGSALAAAASAPTRAAAPAEVRVMAAVAVTTVGSATAPVASGKGASATGGTPLELVQLLTELGALHEANQSDCGALARALARFRDRRGRELGRATPAVYAAIEADPDLAKGMRAAMEKITAASMRCRENPEFERFRETLWTQGDAGG